MKKCQCPATGDTHPSIQADKTQINRVITNLIKNAIESYDDNINKIVAVNCSIGANSVLVSIVDKGHGIADGLKDKIFEPNFTINFYFIF